MSFIPIRWVRYIIIPVSGEARPVSGRSRPLYAKEAIDTVPYRYLKVCDITPSELFCQHYTGWKAFV